MENEKIGGLGMTAKRFTINNDMNLDSNIETYELSCIVDNDNKTFYFVVDSIANVKSFVERLNELHEENERLKSSDTITDLETEIMKLKTTIQQLRTDNTKQKKKLNTAMKENEQLKKEIENLKQGMIHAAFDKEWK